MTRMLFAFTPLSYIMVFALGAAIGSFLGVVVERHPKGRSRCDNCKRQLKWWENIPIVSFIFLKGKCRSCRSPIPYWLPLIELVGGIGGIWVMNQVAPLTKSPMAILNGAALVLIVSALTWVFFSDLVFGIVPDLAVAVGVVGAILSHLSNLSDLSYLLAAVAAAGFFLFLVLITRGRGMGTGDATLAGFLGLWLGWPKILLAVWLAFILGSIIAIGLIAFKRKKFGQTIPFGPFLITGAVISAIAGPELLTIIGL